MSNDDPTQPVKPAETGQSTADGNALKVLEEAGAKRRLETGTSESIEAEQALPEYSFKRFKFGDLNSWAKSPVSDVLDPSTSTFMGSLKRAVTNATRSDVFGSQYIFKAITLYAWQPVGPSAEGFLRLFPEITNAIHVKARIPEIHALPIPTSLSTENNPNDATADWATINLYPTFVAMNTLVSQYGLPQPGEIIYVGFECTSPLSGPIYMGKINKSQRIIQVPPGTLTGRPGFNSGGSSGTVGMAPVVVGMTDLPADVRQGTTETSPPESEETTS